MRAVAKTRDRDASPTSLPEQRMLIPGVSWKDDVILREALDTPGLRMTCCNEELELMSRVASFATREDQDVALRELADALGA